MTIKSIMILFVIKFIAQDNEEMESEEDNQILGTVHSDSQDGSFMLNKSFNTTKKLTYEKGKSFRISHFYNKDKLSALNEDNGSGNEIDIDDTQAKHNSARHEEDVACRKTLLNIHRNNIRSGSTNYEKAKYTNLFLKFEIMNVQRPSEKIEHDD